MEQVKERVESYLEWLRDRTKLKEIDGWVEVTTPYLDRHNDFIQIYAKKSERGYLLTDDGYTLVELEQAGCSLTSPKRKSIFQSALTSFGLHEEDGEIQTRASDANFPIKKHMLIQGILAINDMFYLAQPTVTTLFLEDVTAWLNDLGVRFTQKVKLAGRSGYDHVFDFVIPKSTLQAERLVRAFNSPDKNAAEAMILSWVDTRGARPEESKAYAILNDASRSAPPGVVEALENYNIFPLLWSKRRDFENELVN